MATASASRPLSARRQRREEELDENSARLRAVIGRISRRLRSKQASAGLSPSEIAVLFTVVRAGGEPAGGISLSAVAEREGMHPTMVSRVVASLHEAGLVDRAAAALDRRSALLRPTAAGRRLRERIHREHTEAIARHVRELSAEDARSLWQALPALEQLAEGLGGATR